jgi:hypothetical protein
VRNDLRAAVGHADDVTLTKLREIGQFFWNYAPADCWGNTAIVDAWIKAGGLDGKERTP